MVVVVLGRGHRGRARRATAPRAEGRRHSRQLCAGRGRRRSRGLRGWAGGGAGGRRRGGHGGPTARSAANIVDGVLGGAVVRAGDGCRGAGLAAVAPVTGIACPRGGGVAAAVVVGGGCVVVVALSLDGGGGGDD